MSVVIGLENNSGDRVRNTLESVRDIVRFAEENRV